MFIFSHWVLDDIRFWKSHSVCSVCVCSHVTWLCAFQFFSPPPCSATANFRIVSEKLFFFSLSLWPANSSEISYETTSSRKKIELTLATNEERKSKIARNSREQEPCQPLAFIAFLPTPLLYSAENQLICTFRSTTIVGCPFQSNLQL